MSTIFSCPAPLYARAMVRRFLARYAWVGVAAVVALGVAAIFDTRYVYVLLIVLMVAYPMVFSMIWITKTGSADFVRATRPQRWTFQPDGSAEIEFFRFADNDERHGAPIEVLTLKAENIERIALRKGYTYVWTRGCSSVLIVPTRFTPSSTVQ